VPSELDSRRRLLRHASLLHQQVQQRRRQLLGPRPTFEEVSFGISEAVAADEVSEGLQVGSTWYVADRPHLASAPTMLTLGGVVVVGQDRAREQARSSKTVNIQDSVGKSAWTRPSVARSLPGDYERAAWAWSLSTGSTTGLAARWSCARRGSMYSQAGTSGWCMQDGCTRLRVSPAVIRLG